MNQGSSGAMWRSRGYLPHLEQEERCLAVTFRLADSLPRHVVAAWRSELQSLAKSLRSSEISSRVEVYLDRGYGACHLRNPKAASVVEATLLHFDGTRYRLVAWCVMPNHVHAIVAPSVDSPLAKIVHSWKSFSAKEINRILGRRGRLWQREYHDRLIRDEHHLRRAVRYIEANPTNAGLTERLEDWPWSSASRETLDDRWSFLRSRA